MAKITYDNADSVKINDSVKELINEVADATNNPEVVITSTLRTPEVQAHAMANNLYNGKRIRYRAPGQAVVKVFDDNCKKLARSEVEKLMVAEIERQAQMGQRVSLHCVTEEIYRQCNIIDLSVMRMKNPRDFTNELAKKDKCRKIITPLADGKYTSSKISVDAGEPALHVEINA